MATFHDDHVHRSRSARRSTLPLGSRGKTSTIAISSGTA
jgi:hypothetical protein